MNCKPGEVAVIVRCDNKKNLGKVVRCVEFRSSVKFVDGMVADSWRVDVKLLSVYPGRIATTVPDAWLRPIRDQKGTDEMLRIAGKPKKHSAPTRQGAE